jgi:anti-sigma factor RsiW
MRCEDVTEQLLLRDEEDTALDQHVAGCEHCAHVARGLQRLDAVLGTTLLFEPPLELQRQLAQVALEAAAPKPTPWWQRLVRGEVDLSGWLVLRPQVVAAQGLAALMLALASWQIFGFLSSVRPVVGDVGYAMQLVVGSPAAVHLGGFPVDLQSLALWSAVGAGAWLVSENGYLGRRLAVLTDRIKLP